MAKMKSLSDLGGLVFSTDRNMDLSVSEETMETPPPGQQKLTVRKESKGRAGKTVTVVDGFIGSVDDLDELGSGLKRYCGVGGSVKDGQIVIQGDCRDKVAAFLIKNSYKVHRGN